MRITERQLRQVIRNLTEDKEKPIPGDAPVKKQLHVFDFDDTLGVTSDSNGVMLYRHGEPAWKTAEEAQDWLRNDAGLGDSDLLKGPKGKSFEKPDGIDGFAVYVNSGALPAIKKAASGNVVIAPGKPASDADEAVVFDFSPSNTAKSPAPIKGSVDKVRKEDSEGAKTAIVTARSGEKSKKATKDFAGNDVKVSVEKDLSNFMKSQKAPLNTGVHGTSGANKGEYIKNNLLDPMPDEIHFYDDDASNINKVKDALAGKVPAEVFLYGPGKFQDGTSNPNKPTQSFPAAKKEEEKNESLDRDPLLERWIRIAGIK